MIDKLTHSTKHTLKALKMLKLNLRAAKLLGWVMLTTSLLLGLSANAEPFEQGIQWTPPTKYLDGGTIPPGGIIEYSVYYSVGTPFTGMADFKGKIRRTPKPQILLGGDTLDGGGDQTLYVTATTHTPFGLESAPAFPVFQVNLKSQPIATQPVTDLREWVDGCAGGVTPCSSD